MYPSGRSFCTSVLIKDAGNRGVSAVSAASEMAAAYVGSLGSDVFVLDGAAVGMLFGSESDTEPLVRAPLTWVWMAVGLDVGRLFAVDVGVDSIADVDTCVASVGVCVSAMLPIATSSAEKRLKWNLTVRSPCI